MSPILKNLSSPHSVIAGKHLAGRVTLVVDGKLEDLMTSNVFFNQILRKINWSLLGLQIFWVNMSFGIDPAANGIINQLCEVGFLTSMKSNLDRARLTVESEQFFNCPIIAKVSMTLDTAKSPNFSMILETLKKNSLQQTGSLDRQPQSPENSVAVQFASHCLMPGFAQCSNNAVMNFLMKPVIKVTEILMTYQNGSCHGG